VSRTLRLATGLIIAAYVIPHLVNHALGLVSLDAMEAMRRGMVLVWGNPVGGVLLFGSLLLHFILALVALYRRSHLRIARWQALQLLFGILVPPLIMTHAIGTRVTSELLGMEVTYQYVLAAIWWSGPWTVVKQAALVVVVWIHAAIGLHYWLRLTDWYPRVLPILYPLAVLLPVLALIGYFRTLADVAVAASDRQWLAEVFAERRAAPPEIDAILKGLEPVLLTIMASSLALVLVARLIRHAYRTRHGVYRLRYPPNRELAAPLGQTVLETLRAASIRHASVCGGKGRCTTCRVRVGDGLADLPPPSGIELDALRRIHASPEVRLACQLAPRRDLAVVPLLPPDATARDGKRPGGVEGKERHVTALFVDLRGSTSLGERKMPYDVVFILNQFFAEMAAALKATGGHYSTFTGDGLMALYGLDGTPEDGCKAALAGAAEMARRLQQLNESLATELAEPLRIGIGIHTGLAIVGTMGPPGAPHVSALGDTINVAARLESETKRFDVPMVISEHVARLADVDVTNLAHHEVEVRGRAGAPIGIYCIDSPGAVGSRSE
jgi:adenylate cyclase